MQFELGFAIMSHLHQLAWSCRALSRHNLFQPAQSMNHLRHKCVLNGLAFVVSVVLVVLLLPAVAVADAEGVEFFERQVRPLLVKHCYECHSADTDSPKGSLLLDSRAGWANGGDSGPAVVPGNVDESPLISAVRYESYEMPPQGKLSDADIAILEKWVADGAPDPRDGESQPAAVGGIDIEAGREFWAYQPPRRSPTPAVKDADWPRDDIDRYVLARLEAAELTPAPDTDPHSWLRRVSFDLTGLPPTIDQLEAFAVDPSPAARAAVVDRLLQSPQFGEHWARRWLDVARYADSNGSDFNATFHNAWRYRNYVVAAFNRDEPYDRFIRAQIAGDLLPADSLEQTAEQVVATGFLMIGAKMLSERDKAKLQMDVVDEQIDTVGRAFLGLTLGCARCHDHKFDPIPTRDYYALAGIFRSTRTLEGEIQQYVSDWKIRELPMPNELAAAVESHRVRMTDLRSEKKATEQRLKSAEQQLASVQRPGLLADNPQAELVGSWTASTFTRGFVGEGYIHDDNQDKGEKSVVFTLAAPRAAVYEVQIAYSNGSNRAANVPISIAYAEGESQVTLDQTKAPPIDNVYGAVGRFAFQPDQPARVTISNEGTSGYVIVDAVRLIELNDAGQPVEADGADTAPEVVKAREAVATAKKRLAELDEQLKALEAAAPVVPRAIAVEEAQDIGDCELCVRGDHKIRGPAVPRGVLSVATFGEPPNFSPGESGRRELAEWIADRDNPLTARVIVNRVWAHLLGEGIVRSVDNFGLLGDRPSHPELLDRLAVEFMDDQWSLKRLIRRIVLSRVYGMSSRHDEAAWMTDPENRWLWRAHRRPLPAEAIRDSLLAVSGRLDLSPGQSPVAGLGKLVNNNSANSDEYQRQESMRRSLYLPIIRNELPPILTVFDFADPDMSTGKRNATNVPAQALLLMNSPFVIESCQQTAKHLLSNPQLAPAERLRQIYQQILSRPPTEAETERALQFLADCGSNETATGGKNEPDDAAAAELAAWSQLVQVLFASTEFRILN